MTKELEKELGFLKFLRRTRKEIIQKREELDRDLQDVNGEVDKQFEKIEIIALKRYAKDGKRDTGFGVRFTGTSNIDIPQELPEVKEFNKNEKRKTGQKPNKG